MKKNKKKKEKQQIVLNKNLAILTAVVVGGFVSILGGQGFYKIITKIAPASYDASLNKTLLTVSPLIFIGITIVILFILLVSQTNLDD